MRKTVDLSFRNLIKDFYPGLGKNLSYWRFMRYLIFGRKDEATGYPLIDRYHIAKAEDKLELLKSNNYCAEKFLLSFQQEVMTKESFSWSDWSFKDNEARVAFVQFPEKIQIAIEQETYKVMAEKRVYFDNGYNFSDKLQKIDRELIRQEALTYVNLTAPEAKDLLEYMNQVSVHNFSKVVAKNLNATLIEAFKIEDPEKRRVQIEIINTIRDELQPFYKPSEEGNTVRIFPLNQSIPMLRKELRKLLTKGWYEFDLANSQLAIVGKTWEISEVQDFLCKGGKIWKELFAHYGIDAVELKQNNPEKYEAIKSVLKDALYSLIYGMWKKNLITFLNEGLEVFGIKEAGKKFFKHPLMAALFNARENKILEISGCDSVETIFGKTLKVVGSVDNKGKPTASRKKCIRGIMAQQAQAVELYLLLPVLELAKSTNDFVICLWQHDGFSVNFTDKTKKDRWVKRINEAVNEKAASLGIITQLEGAEL